MNKAKLLVFSVSFVLAAVLGVLVVVLVVLDETSRSPTTPEQVCFSRYDGQWMGVCGMSNRSFEGMADGRTIVWDAEDRHWYVFEGVGWMTEPIDGLIEQRRRTISE